MQYNLLIFAHELIVLDEIWLAPPLLPLFGIRCGDTYILISINCRYTMNGLRLNLRRYMHQTTHTCSNIR